MITFLLQLFEDTVYQEVEKLIKLYFFHNKKSLFTKEWTPLLEEGRGKNLKFAFILLKF